MFNSNQYDKIPDPDAGIRPGLCSGPYAKGRNETCFCASQTHGPYENLECISYSHVNLVHAMRYLWLQMVIWSRSYIHNCRARQEALPVVYERLYSVPVEFYNYMNLFFGQQIAEKHIYLMSQHVIIFSNLINSMFAGNHQAANLSRSAWYENAESLASFMFQLCDAWSNNEWRDLMNSYMKMHIEEAIAIFTADYSKEIAIYDRLQYHSMRMADYMSRGVIQSLAGNTKNQVDP